MPDYVSAMFGCAAPMAFGTDHAFSVSFSLYAGSTKLYAGPDVNPFESSVISVDPETFGTKYGEIDFVTSSVAAAGRVTSPFDASFDKELVVFGAADVTSIQLGDIDNVPMTQLTVGGTGYLYPAALLIGDQRGTCGDAFPRSYRTLTPSTCQVSGGGLEGVTLVGVAAGTCTVEASLDGTNRSVQRTYVVR